MPALQGVSGQGRKLTSRTSIDLTFAEGPEQYVTDTSVQYLVFVLEKCAEAVIRSELLTRSLTCWQLGHRGVWEPSPATETSHLRSLAARSLPGLPLLAACGQAAWQSQPARLSLDKCARYALAVRSLAPSRRPHVHEIRSEETLCTSYSRRKAGPSKYSIQEAFVRHIIHTSSTLHDFWLHCHIDHPASSTLAVLHTFKKRR